MKCQKTACSPRSAARCVSLSSTSASPRRPSTTSEAATSCPRPCPGTRRRPPFARLAEGDEAAKQLLIEHNLRLVVYIARRFENTGINLEDLVSIGSIGLIKAINTFNASKSIKLATYASRCIENEILMYLRKMRLPARGGEL